jgi:hypothetical protein
LSGSVLSVRMAFRNYIRAEGNSTSSVKKRRLTCLLPIKKDPPCTFDQPLRSGMSERVIEGRFAKRLDTRVIGTCGYSSGSRKRTTHGAQPRNKI